jgi:FKBP-type peptidyl-prolyl cis-trans isomerase FkpA
MIKPGELFSLLILAAIGSCSGPEQTRDSVITDHAVRESLIRANQQLNFSESEEIEKFQLRKGWQMKRTGTGLRYLIDSTGSGLYAKPGMRATVKFKLSLLNGKICYSSDSTGLEQFIIDQDEVESGLHEGIKLMRAGDKAKFILPSHLAHGLAGDHDCIPARSPVIYDIELIQLK